MMNAHAMFAPLTDAERAEADAEAASSASDKRPIVPVPDDAPPMRFRHPVHGEPAKAWAYHDAEGRLVGYVCRWDFVGKDGEPAKEILPVALCDLGGGKRGWRSKGLPAPRPLFGLPRILADGATPILVVEGEKTRDAAETLFPDWIATTPAHGSQSPHLADWSPVTGRVVIVAPDADPAGDEFGDRVAELCRSAGAAAVKRLVPETLGMFVFNDGVRTKRDGDLPRGFDFADAVDDGWTAERVAELAITPDALPGYLNAEARETLRRVAAGEPDAMAVWPFRVTRSGVEKKIEKTDPDTGEVIVEWRWFCSVLEVSAETRSVEGEDWGRLLTVIDRDGKSKEWAMPMAMLAGDGIAYRERLLSLGLIMAAGRFARDSLHEYIITARPSIKARCVNRLGWNGRAFVLPRKTWSAQ